MPALTSAGIELAANATVATVKSAIATDIVEKDRIFCQIWQCLQTGSTGECETVGSGKQSGHKTPKTVSGHAAAATLVPRFHKEPCWSSFGIMECEERRWVDWNAIVVGALGGAMLGSAIVGVAAWFYITTSQQSALEYQDATETAQKLRAEERKGRIRAEQTIRELLAAPAAGDAGSMPVRAVATMISPLRGRWGAPRQGLLCPSLRGVLLFREGTPREALRGITEFSHCWLIWRFHKNTNVQKERTGSVKSQGLGVPALVSPPGLYGERRGVFATRSPHRPNAIGLSLVQVEGFCTVDAFVDAQGLVATTEEAITTRVSTDATVKFGPISSQCSGPGSKGKVPAGPKQRRCRLLALSVRGSDLIHGTPVLDIKPYLGPGLDEPAPVRDMITGPHEASAAELAAASSGAAETGALRLPDWVRKGRAASWPVEVGREAQAEVRRIRDVSGRGAKWLEVADAFAAEPVPRVSRAVGAIHGSAKTALSAATEVLALDPRGVRMGRGCHSSTAGVVSEVEVVVDGLSVRAQFGEGVVVTKVQPQELGEAT